MKDKKTKPCSCGWGFPFGGRLYIKGDIKMKKNLLLLATVFTLGAVSPVLAQEDNAERISEIETQIKELQAELKELKGDSGESEVIADDEMFYIEFVEVREKENFMGDGYEFVFEVENKTDLNIEVQARNVSIDGRMVDES